MDDKITFAEIKAVKLLIDAGLISVSTERTDYHREADRIILLAEEIKAERATAAMLNH
jgi:hypothetical protein